MSEIFEIFGHRLDDDSEEAERHRSTAWCPFMDMKCDGGGNRHQTEIDLTKDLHSDLTAKFPDREKLIPGVCSLVVTKGQAPWIICPRRLLVLARQKIGERTYQLESEIRLLKLLNYPPATRVGIWREVRLFHVGKHKGIAKEFDYTFDYILMPINDVSIVDTLMDDRQIGDERQIDVSLQDIEKKRRSLQKQGFKITEDSQAQGGYIVYDYPRDIPASLKL